MLGMWKTLIAIWCWVVVAFGALLATGAVSSIDAPARLAFAILGNGAVGLDFLEAPGMRFAVGLMGAVTLGWGLTIRILVYAAGGDKAVWKSMIAAFAVWYVIDCAISLATGFWLNAISNTVLFASFLAIVFASGVLGERQQATA